MPIYSTPEILTHLPKDPQRVVSLVPSVSDSLFQFGLAERVVGTTDYCPLPTGVEQPPQRVGGTKDPEVEAIRALEPDLVIANREENGREAVEALARAGLAIWLMFPTTVQQAIEDLWAMARLFHHQAAVGPRLELLEKTLDWTALASQAARGKRYFCPIWHETSPQLGPWWMTFNDQTYSGDLLARCGGTNAFGARQRRYPLAADLGAAEPEEPGVRDVRYPRVSVQEVRAAAPEIILLPSEPFAFSEKDELLLRRELADTPAVQRGEIHRVDGRLIAWPGMRLAQALAELPPLLQC